jgi:hypothetical protein
VRTPAIIRGRGALARETHLGGAGTICGNIGQLRATHKPAGSAEGSVPCEVPDEPRPRDAYEWLCQAEDALSDTRRRTAHRQLMLAWMERAIDYIEEARKLVA